MGDLLFSCVNLARHLGVEPDGALRRANRKFRRRFRYMEDGAGVALEDMSAEQLEELWEGAKGGVG
ncbi:MAG: hypothetical protein ACR2PJ_07740 [Pseudomonadales bacterium]